jgi:hypothetical protein
MSAWYKMIPRLRSLALVVKPFRKWLSTPIADQNPLPNSLIDGSKMLKFLKGGRIAVSHRRRARAALMNLGHRHVSKPA